MKIETEVLKALVSKAIIGAGNNKIIPMTTFIGINVETDKITFITTDGTNYLYVFDEIDAEDNFYAVINAEQFSKLVGKLTSKFTELSVIDNILEIKANGKYTIELQLDENGEAVVYPNKYDEFIQKPTGTIDKSCITTILNTIKPSLATAIEEPVITNYYVGDSTMATNGYKVASFNINLLNSNKLISSELMYFFSGMDDNTIDYYIRDYDIMFTDTHCIVCGKIDTADDYPVDALEKLLSDKFPSSCKIEKQGMLNLLDRMSLLVGKYDKKAIRMSFKKNAIDISNMANKSNEAVDYISVSKYKEFDCVVDIEILTTQIKAYAKDIVELHFGKENALKLVDGDITQLIALNENE